MPVSDARIFIRIYRGSPRSISSYIFEHSVACCGCGCVSHHEVRPSTNIRSDLTNIIFTVEDFRIGIFKNVPTAILSSVFFRSQKTELPLDTARFRPLDPSRATVPPPSLLSADKTTYRRLTLRPNSVPKFGRRQRLNIIQAPSTFSPYQCVLCEYRTRVHTFADPKSGLSPCRYGND